ncbi:MAG TPA: transporter associated domain-containing protein, partial [Bacillota bacterium]|nr:transporter associated domain-containing protein [Bacillota bacterium]
GKVDLKAIMTPAIYVAKTAPLPEVIDVMKKTHQQLAIVVDSYGGTVGLLTMEDALEVLVGDIWDESDDILPDFIKISDDEYDIGASLRVDELAEELDIYLDEISEYYTTVGGWIVGSAEVEIKPGYKFDYDGLHFTVSTMDGRRIERIKLTTDETALKRHGSYSSI